MKENIIEKAVRIVSVTQDMVSPALEHATGASLGVSISPKLFLELEKLAVYRNHERVGLGSFMGYPVIRISNEANPIEVVIYEKEENG